ncbi:MAG TPA: hypothetical protein VGU23_08585 [Acidobacteriaceae bacterium]|nr:hypothetical protein [Acidobacteriaceae bacterium]
MSLSLALSLAFTPLLRAQQATNLAPIPQQISSAHTIFLSNGGGSNYFDRFTGGADRAYNSLYAGLRQWNRYQFVDSPAQADLVFEIRAIAPSTGGPNDIITYNPQLVLRIVDPKTGTALWTTSSNVEAFGRQKRRDRQFDHSLDVLVDKLAQLTGQPLTASQAHAVRDNSSTHMPTAAKVALTLSIVGSAALLGFMIHQVTEPHPLPGATQPAAR